MSKTWHKRITQHNFILFDLVRKFDYFILFSPFKRKLNYFSKISKVELALLLTKHRTENNTRKTIKIILKIDRRFFSFWSNNFIIILLYIIILFQ